MKKSTGIALSAFGMLTFGGLVLSDVGLILKNPNDTLANIALIINLISGFLFACIYLMAILFTLRFNYETANWQLRIPSQIARLGLAGSALLYAQTPGKSSYLLFAGMWGILFVGNLLVPTRRPQDPPAKEKEIEWTPAGSIEESVFLRALQEQARRSPPVPAGKPKPGPSRCRYCDLGKMNPENQTCTNCGAPWKEPYTNE